MTTCLYHKVPSVLSGKELVPLATLMQRAPELAEASQKKYEGRDTLKTTVPPLNCWWSEVIFLSPVHPEEIWSSLKLAGIRTFPTYFFVIPIEVMDPECTTIMVQGRSSGKERIYEAFSADSVHKYMRLPEITQKYFRECAEKNVRPFLFRGIPHVLFRGEIPYEGLERISVG